MIRAAHSPVIARCGPAWAGFVTGIACLLTACGTQPPPVSPPASGGGTPSPSSSAGPVVVPVKVMTRPNRGRKPLVGVSVGGGRPVPVILDKGAGGLYVLPGALGSQVSRAGRSGRRTYQDWSLTENEVWAPFRIGGVGTASPIRVRSITSVSRADLCWQVGEQRACGPTLLDTGDPTAFASAALLANVPSSGSFVRPGLAVSISAPPPSSVALRSFTTAPTPPDVHLGYAQQPIFNTGIGPYLTNQIGFDLAAGQAVVTPG